MEDFPIHSKLVDGTDCKILLNTKTIKSFKSEMFYLNCPSLHSLPNFVLNTKKN